jgi:hypothetical protein
MPFGQAKQQDYYIYIQISVWHTWVKKVKKDWALMLPVSVWLWQVSLVQALPPIQMVLLSGNGQKMEN